MPAVTPNEKSLLKAFEKVGEASVIAMAGKVGLTIHYTKYLCQRLCGMGKLELASRGLRGVEGEYPVYRIRGWKASPEDSVPEFLKKYLAERSKQE